MSTESKEWKRRMCEKFAAMDDRDRSLCFHGRDAEMARIESAVDDSKTKDETVFRIVQGAPGAGKTSMLDHMRKNVSEDRLYVRLKSRDLTTMQTLKAAVDDALTKRDPLWARGVKRILEHANHAFRATSAAGAGGREAGALGDAVAKSGSGAVDAIVNRLSDKLELVLMLDEAQTLGEEKNTHLTLKDLHADGLGRPSVLVLAGLSHTSDEIASIPGLSRPSRKAVVNLGLLPEGDCRASTLDMLEQIAVRGTPEEKDEAAARVAAMSKNWPQHLCGAQSSLAEELLNRDGRLAEVDWAGIEQRSDEYRYAYYMGRLTTDPNLKHTVYTTWLIEAIRQRGGSLREDEMAEDCHLAMGSVPMPLPLKEADNPPTASKMVRAMIAKGIFSKTDETHYEISIPSMGDWLAEQAGNGRGRLPFPETPGRGEVSGFSER